MSAVSRANRAKIPHDFPNPHRLGGTDLFRAVLGNPAASTFARWRAEGRLPPPRKIGALNRWPETVMAETRDAGFA
jgi:hypothetical protein